MIDCDHYCVQSLYKLSLDELCRSMNEELLKIVLKNYQPSIVLQIIWKILYIDNESNKFVNCHSYPKSTHEHPVNRGLVMAKMKLQYCGIHSDISYRHLSTATHEEFALTQQTKFDDKCNFCNHFDLELFFNLVEVTEGRSQLFTIFQLCIQVNGFQFPKRLAQEWIQSETLNSGTDDNHSHYIDQGLKLGIFLADCGWLSESALVLSHTYKLISTKWVCLNRDMKLMKTIQCLTKWLLAASNYYNFDEAKVVLQYMLVTLSVLEKIEGRKLCIAYAYIAISQYFYVLMEYNKSWSWAVKAVNELHDQSADILKLLVISHVIKVGSNLNKLDMAKKLIAQLHTYDKVIDQSTYVELLLNEACYSLKADLVDDAIPYYYTALDTRRNLFGYYNLYTANVFVDYAYARYVCNYSNHDFNEPMRSILQGIFIMKKIGLSDDNMLLVIAGRIKALILEEKALEVHLNELDIFMMNEDLDEKGQKQLEETIKNKMLSEAEALHLKALEVSLKVVGEKTLLSAKSYCNLGRLYQSQQKYQLCEQMHLKAIQIKESILGENNPEVALSLGHLASLYTYQLNEFRKAEKLYLRSKAIYEAAYGHQYTGIMYDLKGLLDVYNGLNDEVAFRNLDIKLTEFYETREAWLSEVHSTNDKNCIQEDLSLEKFKCIMNECGCEKS